VRIRKTAIHLDRWALAKAGITDPLLGESYELCRRVLVAMDGPGWNIALLALPPRKRPHVWALYGFARWADEIVDSGAPGARAEELSTWSTRVLADLRAGRSRDPFCSALLHTMRSWNIGVELIEEYLNGMWMSLTLAEHKTYADLRRYTDASIVSVGRQVLAVLESQSEEAIPRMDALSTAMYLTDIIQDIGEDLRWGRLCLPLDELAAFNLTRAELERGQVTPAIRELLRFQIERARELYAFGMPLVDLVHPSGRLAVRAITTVFRMKLEEIERRGYDVFTARPWISAARVPGLLLRIGTPRNASPLGAHR
jgi:phytoene synthase